MRKILVIAARDYTATVQTKTFLISLVFLPLMMGGSFLVQALLKDTGGNKPRRFAVIDRTAEGWLYPGIEAAAQKRNQQAEEQNQRVFNLERVEPSADTPEAIRQQRFALSELVRQRELYGFVDIGPAVDSLEQSGPDAENGRNVVRYHSNSTLSREFPQWLSQQVETLVQERRSQKLELSHEKVKQVQLPVALASKALLKRNARTGEIEEGPDGHRVASFLMPFGLVMLMFMMIFIGATPLMQGVIEEKTNRIAEVLLGSVQPFQLMMGKLLGCLGVATTLAVIYLGGAYWAAHYNGYAEYLPLDVLVWFLVFQTLGVLMYGSMFISVGAACTNVQESQTFLMPVMLLAMLPMFVLVKVIEEPDSNLATALSLFPPSTPMLMVMRQAIPPGIPWWQPAVGVVLVLATTVLCVWTAGRIFRVGILMQGQAAKMSDLARWVFQG